jgi:hypothetical protein
VYCPDRGGRADGGTGVLLRHDGFGEGCPEIDLGHTAQTWALIHARLVRYVADATPQPHFPAVPASASMHFGRRLR